METIRTGPLGRDRGKFMELLEAVRTAARDDGHAKIVSVSLAAGKFIDPLAVVESVAETGQRHFYCERPDRGEAIAGAESAAQAEFAGTERFAQARDYCRNVYDNTIAVGQLEQPMAGPKIFCAFSFEDDDDPTAPFRPATLFVPRWQVSACEGAYVATANLAVAPDSNLDAEAARILAAHEKFSTFDYTRVETGSDFRLLIADDERDAENYAAKVEEALRAIRAGECAKIVVARRKYFTAPAKISPFGTLARVRDRFPSCSAFSIAAGDGSVFLGASPETLARVRNGLLETEALAGTAMRGKNPAEDAKLAAGLFGSDKELREHRAVAETIHGKLIALGLDPGPMPRPRLLRLRNAQHIRTPFLARVENGLHLLDIARALHPTPATAGLPTGPAIGAIRRIEGGPRGLYSGLVGWCDEKGEGELAVALRSGMIRDNEGVLFAGAGIVEGSEKHKEIEETRLKMSALGGLLG
jgi:menaquinone-specific isochorismate synthase